MNNLNIQEVQTYVETHIADFHKDRLEALKKLKLKSVLKRKNPYLFRAKNVETAGDIVKAIVNAYISSQEETIFGNWLEGLAIFINGKVYGGMKSSTDGLDLEFSDDGKRYLVSIKSGPSWGNASQIEKMKGYFIEGEKRVNTSVKKEQRTPCIFINGCCYGTDDTPCKEDKKGFKYYKLCGQRFWYFISGKENLYTEIVEPLGHKAKEKNDEYQEALSKMINQFTLEFIKDFCKKDGAIDWDKIVVLNSKAKNLSL